MYSSKTPPDRNTYSVYVGDEFDDAVEANYEMCQTIEHSLLWPGASQWRIYYHRICVQLSTTYSNVLKQPNGEVLVAVNNSQLRTMWR